MYNHPLLAVNALHLFIIQDETGTERDRTQLVTFELWVYWGHRHATIMKTVVQPRNSFLFHV